MDEFRAVTGNVIWIVAIGIVVLAIAWAVISRVRSRRWGHPTEFAGTMPSVPPEAHEALEEAYARGEISVEEYHRRMRALERD